MLYKKNILDLFHKKILIGISVLIVLSISLSLLLGNKNQLVAEATTTEENTEEKEA